MINYIGNAYVSTANPSWCPLAGCPADAGCGGNACITDGCAAAACGANYCTTAGCGADGCGGNACSIAGCGGNGCVAAVCYVDACPVNACFACFVDIFPWSEDGEGKE